MKEEPKGTDKVEVFAESQFGFEFSQKKEAKEIMRASNGRNKVFTGECENCHDGGVAQEPAKGPSQCPPDPIEGVVVDGDNGNVPPRHVVSQETTVVKNRGEAPDTRVGRVHKDGEGVWPVFVKENAFHVSVQTSIYIYPLFVGTR